MFQFFSTLELLGHRNPPRLGRVLSSIHRFRILLNSVFFVLSDISGLLNGSLANYMILNSISQQLTLNSHEIITFANLRKSNMSVFIIFLFLFLFYSTCIIYKPEKSRMIFFSFNLICNPNFAICK